MQEKETLHLTFKVQIELWKIGFVEGKCFNLNLNTPGGHTLHGAILTILILSNSSMLYRSNYTHVVE